MHANKHNYYSRYGCPPNPTPPWPCKHGEAHACTQKSTTTTAVMDVVQTALRHTRESALKPLGIHKGAHDEQRMGPTIMKRRCLGDSKRRIGNELYLLTRNAMGRLGCIPHPARIERRDRMATERNDHKAGAARVVRQMNCHQSIGH